MFSWLPVLPAALFDLALSLPRQWRMETTGFDLGIFEQAVRGYAGLGAPVATLKATGFDLLGDHFSPLLAVLAPVYRLFPGAATLLVVQALLLALSCGPVTGLAVQRLGRGRGVAIGLAYGLSWGLWTADRFDFHEVALAVPLAACATVALARERYRTAVSWAVPLLLVKEDQGLLLAGIGVYLCWRGQRRLGAATVLLAVAATALTVLVLVPALNPGGEYSYGANGAWHGENPLGRLLLPGLKWQTVALLLAPTLFLALRSPLSLLAVLPLAARFWSPSETYWEPTHHYNAVLMPVLFVALVDGLHRLRDRRWLSRRAPAAALLLALAWAPLPCLSPPGPQLAVARQTLAVIPDGASVAAANRLAPQLTNRCTVSLFPFLTAPGAAGPSWRPVAEWVAVLDDPDGFPVPTDQQRAAQDGLPQAGYRVVAVGGGVTVYHWRAG
ncbi:DUF2079 domain-containing protein [Kitasatospora azatica]|uniref:DUF2079 domain-containing protein n=1 Tax=Kitasatospora azatica TaxID=58347 RepID=UPI0005659985|nr:DUF2079 domain-containing protein [Kitasatospora azatica]